MATMQFCVNCFCEMRLCTIWVDARQSNDSPNLHVMFMWKAFQEYSQRQTYPQTTLLSILNAQTKFSLCTAYVWRSRSNLPAVAQHSAVSATNTLNTIELILILAPQKFLNVLCRNGTKRGKGASSSIRVVVFIDHPKGHKSPENRNRNIARAHWRRSERLNRMINDHPRLPRRHAPHPKILCIFFGHPSSDKALTSRRICDIFHY